jgi:hypothetical protein
VAVIDFDAWWLRSDVEIDPASSDVYSVVDRIGGGWQKTLEIRFKDERDK